MAGDRVVRASSVVADEDGWSAIVPLPSGASLSISADAAAVEVVRVQLWADFDKGIGMAVLLRANEPASLARIPMCRCGERGCAHSGRQLNVRPRSDELLELIDRLDPLDVSGNLADDQAVWLPNLYPNQG